jgi:hypothetical protein
MTSQDDDQPLPRRDRRGRMRDDFLSHETGWPSPNGIMLADGTRYGLEGQPPVAVSKGWGDLSWLLSRYRGP